jgi:hypothetical protein
VPNVPWAGKSLWAHPMVVLVDVCRVEARFGPLEIVLVLAHAQFAITIPHTWKSFQAHPMVLLGDVGQVEAHFGPYGDSFNLKAR